MTPTVSADASTRRIAQDGSVEILGLARRQHGVVARRQLLDAGFSRASIYRRVRSIRLVPVFPGVYGVGTDVLTGHGRWMAGVLAGGPGTVLSHQSAAALWGLIDEGPRVEITRAFNMRSVPGLAPGCAHPGLRIRRTRWLDADHVTQLAGIHVMCVERTLLSLAATASPWQVEAALVASERSGQLDRRVLAGVLERGHGWKGIGLLRRLAGEIAPVDSRSRSPLEDRFIAACLDAGLPAPRVNTVVEGFEVDLFWPEARVIVELDGFEYHSDRLAFERDRERDAVLVRSGYRVVRFTYRAVQDQIPRCLETVGRLIGSGPGPGLGS